MTGITVSRPLQRQLDNCQTPTHHPPHEKEVTDAIKKIAKIIGKKMDLKFELPVAVPGCSKDPFFNHEAKEALSKFKDFAQIAKINNYIADSLNSQADHILQGNISTKQKTQYMKTYGTLEKAVHTLKSNAEARKIEANDAKSQGIKMANESKGFHELSKVLSWNSIQTAAVGKAGFTIGEQLWNLTTNPSLQNLTDSAAATGNAYLKSHLESVEKGIYVIFDTKVATALQKHGLRHVAKFVPSANIAVPAAKIGIHLYYFPSLQNFSKLVASSACDLGCMYTVAKILSTAKNLSAIASPPSFVAAVAWSAVAGFMASGLKQTLFHEHDQDGNDKRSSPSGHASLYLSPELIDKMLKSSGHKDFSAEILSHSVKTFDRQMQRDSQLFHLVSPALHSHPIQFQSARDEVQPTPDQPINIPNVKAEPIKPKITVPQLLENIQPRFTVPQEHANSSDSNSSSDPTVKATGFFTASNEKGIVAISAGLGAKVALSSPLALGGAVVCILAGSGYLLYRWIADTKKEKRCNHLHRHLSKGLDILNHTDNLTIANLDDSKEELRRAANLLTNHKSLREDFPSLLNDVNRIIEKIEQTQSEFRQIDAAIRKYNKAVEAYKEGKFSNAKNLAQGALHLCQSTIFANEATTLAKTSESFIRQLSVETRKAKLDEHRTEYDTLFKSYSQQISDCSKNILEAKDEKTEIEKLQKLHESSESLNEMLKTLQIDHESLANASQHDPKLVESIKESIQNLQEQHNELSLWHRFLSGESGPATPQQRLFQVMHFTNKERYEEARGAITALIHEKYPSTDLEFAAQVAGQYYKVNALTGKKADIKDVQKLVEHAKAQKFINANLNRAIGFLFFQANDKCHSAEALAFYNTCANNEPNSPLWQAFIKFGSYEWLEVDQHLKEAIELDDAVKKQQDHEFLQATIRLWALTKFQIYSLFADSAGLLLSYGVKKYCDKSIAEKIEPVVNFALLPSIYQRLLLSIVESDYQDSLEKYLKETGDLRWTFRDVASAIKEPKEAWKNLACAMKAPKEILTKLTLEDFATAISLFSATTSIISPWITEKERKVRFQKWGKIADIVNKVASVPECWKILRELQKISTGDGLTLSERFSFTLTSLRLITIVPTMIYMGEELYHFTYGEKIRSTNPLLVGAAAIHKSALPTIVFTGYFIHRHQEALKNGIYFAGAKLASPISKGVSALAKKTIINAVAKRLPKVVAQKLSEKAIANMAASAVPVVGWALAVGGAAWTAYDVYKMYWKEDLARHLSNGETNLQGGYFYSAEKDFKKAQAWKADDDTQTYEGGLEIKNSFLIDHRIYLCEAKQEIKELQKLKGEEETTKKLRGIAKICSFTRWSNSYPNTWFFLVEELLSIGAQVNRELKEFKKAKEALNYLITSSENPGFAHKSLAFILLFEENNIKYGLKHLFIARTKSKDDEVNEINSLIEAIVCKKLQDFSNPIKHYLETAKPNDHLEEAVKAMLQMADQGLKECKENLLDETQKLYKDILPKEHLEELLKIIEASYVKLKDSFSGCEKKSSSDQKESLPAYHAGKQIGDRRLRIYTTQADGSCAFHALLGVPNEEGTYICDAASARQTFVTWLRGNPARARTVLHELFDNFDRAHSGFKTEYVMLKYTQARHNYSQLSQEEQETNRDEFVNDPEVLNAYCTLMMGDYWLSQDELELAACCFNKTVKLFQPEQGTNNAESIGQGELNPGKLNIVNIWYNGRDHYEFAQFE